MAPSPRQNPSWSKTADHDFLFVVRTPVAYSRPAVPNNSRRTVLSSEARSHAALVSHRRRHHADHDEERKNFVVVRPSRRVLKPKSLVTEDAFDSNAELVISSHALGLRPGKKQLMPPLTYPVDILPGIAHRDTPGFDVAAVFHALVSPRVLHAPVFQIFDVSNTFSQCYYDLARHEVGLAAGVAVVNMVRDVWRPDFQRTGTSPQVRRMIQRAITKLRRSLPSNERSLNESSSSDETDAAIMAATFLGHIAKAFGDGDAFRMHRQGIRTMIDAQGGLDALGLDGMVKCSVLQFESWWTHLYDDTSVFASSRPEYEATYLRPPFSTDTLLQLSRLPPLFAQLAQCGMLATDIVAVLSRTVTYHQHHIARNPTSFSSPFSSSPRPRDDFWQATSCLLVRGPHFEKYFVFALLLFINIAFTATRQDRMFLACSHTAFRTPRECLTKQLPVFNVSGLGSSREATCARVNENVSEIEVDRALEDCLAWMRMVLIWGWIATDGVENENVRRLVKDFKSRSPDHGSWDKVDDVLGRCLWTEEMRMTLRACWMQ